MATIARMLGVTPRVVRCAGADCRQYIRTDFGDEVELFKDNKEFCDGCAASERCLKEEVVRMKALFEKMRCENFPGYWKKILGFPLSAAEKQTMINFNKVRRRCDRARLSLANKRLGLLEAAEKAGELAASERAAVKHAAVERAGIKCPAVEGVAGAARPIQSLPIRRKRARSESPDAAAGPNKRVQFVKAATKGILKSKDGPKSRARHKVSFSQPRDPREVNGYRDQAKYLRDSDEYRPGSHVASRNFTLVNTSGFTLSFDDFYSGNHIIPNAINEARMSLMGLSDDGKDDVVDEDDASLPNADNNLRPLIGGPMEDLAVVGENKSLPWLDHRHDEGVVLNDSDPYAQLYRELQDDSFEDSGFAEILARGVNEGLGENIAGRSAPTSPLAVAAGEYIDPQALQLGGQYGSTGGEGWIAKSGFPVFQGSLSVVQNGSGTNEMPPASGRSDQLDKAYGEMEGIAKGLDGEKVIR
ncbi:uncharacterized protein BDZ99DRAFT_515374 [Mytilinidion resinicola]|uniref:Uncharacterized protein n=1 Tax=Mytilinidion resinicola TaxID=574789 RepID=A0A6A6Z2X3_9PEZI|nr:uncharacterized protein BDZ99DRAFT_515374 [Mytilinidion resinicola]KAF2814587.1 hypothetical protein BDZ99DRAFT_515374 [Mytilinidion resinicola]